MATVIIGGRELDVRPATLGFMKSLIPWRQKLVELGDTPEAVDHIARGLLLYVGHNEGVTLDWLLDHVPYDPTATIRACRDAAGLRASDAPGEAASP